MKKDKIKSTLLETCKYILVIVGWEIGKGMLAASLLGCLCGFAIGWFGIDVAIYIIKRIKTSPKNNQGKGEENS